MNLYRLDEVNMRLSREEEIWLKKQQSFFKNNYQNNRNAITSFLTPKEQLILQMHIRDYKMVFDGGYENAERRQAYVLHYPLKEKEYCIFQLRYNKKFHEIGHRDVLGSVLSLGIERNQIGDIIVQNDIVQIIVAKKIAPFLLQNFTMIKTAKIQLQEVEQVIEKEEDYDEIECFVSSFRLDVFVSAFTKLSRKVASEMIEKGLVQVNHEIIYSSNYQCKTGDLISVRKYGRYIFQEEMTRSKKGRHRILYLHQK